MRIKKKGKKAGPPELMNPEDVLGELVRLKYDLRKKEPPHEIDIPAGAVGVVSGYAGGFFEIKFPGQDTPVRFSPGEFVVVTEPVDMGPGPTKAPN